MKTDTFIEKYDRAVAASHRIALAIGYGEIVDDRMKLDAAVEWKAAIDEFQKVAQALALAVVRANVFLPDAVSMAERVDVLKKSVDKSTAASTKARRDADDAKYQGRA